MQAVPGRMLEKKNASYYRLVANLPYDVATSVVANLLVDELPIRSLTITVQYEVGLRMAAEPGSRDYGPLSALIQRSEVSNGCEHCRRVFSGRSLMSIHVSFVSKSMSRNARISKSFEFGTDSSAICSCMPKMLRSAVASIPGYKVVKPKLDALFEGLGLSGDVRSGPAQPRGTVVVMGRSRGDPCGNHLAGCPRVARAKAGRVSNQ